MARPTKYNNKLAVDICTELADGKSMRTICAMAGMPAMSTVFKWLAEKPEFTEQYERAKQEQADAMIEDMLDIADNENQDTQRSRLRVDTRKWIASKLKPKKYGEKIEHSGKVSHELEFLEAIKPTTGLPSDRDK